MSGIIDTVGSKSGNVGSDVYPAGMLRQVKHVLLGTIASGSDNAYFPNSASFDNSILSTSDVLLTATGVGTKRHTTVSDGFADLYFSSDTAGSSLGDGLSGHRFALYLNYGNSPEHQRFAWAGQHLVVTPGTTTPTFKVFVFINATHNMEFEDSNSSITLWEITG
jgi:hypothetical protein